MELFTVKVPRDTYFKVVSDKRVAASIGGGPGYHSGAPAGLGGGSGPGPGGGWSLFYLSTDGGFAGKEFIFMAQPSGRYAEASPPHHTIFAVEEAEVTVYDAAGNSVLRRTMKANSTYSGPFIRLREVYRVVSTGRIMFSNWVGNSYTVLPSMFGGFVGTRFFTKEEAASHGRLETVFLMVIAQDQAVRVRAFDPLANKVFGEGTVEPRRMFLADENQIPYKRENTIVTTTAPAIVFSGDVNASATGETRIYQIADGVTFFGIKADQPASFFIVAKGIVFSPDANARVTIDGLTINVKKGGYATLPTGLLTVTSNATIIVEALSQADRGQLLSWGSYLITPEAVDIVYPPPQVKEEFPITMVGAAIAAVILVFIVALVTVRRRGKQP
jgi:hypothetical protein